MSDGAAGAAREEAARTGTYLAMMALAIPVLVWLERVSSSPDAWRMVKMRAALEAERFCMRSAMGWARLADAAHSLYERERV